MKISDVKKVFYFAIIIGIFAYFLLISFNEELLFLSIFITIVFSVYRLFGDSVGLQLDTYTNQIAKEFVLLASSKSVALHTLRNYSNKVSSLGDDIINLVGFGAGLCESLGATYEREFRDSFILLKHKQLKLLLVEGYQLLRLLYIRRFMFYWREVRDLLLLSAKKGSYSFVFSGNLNNSLYFISSSIQGSLNWLEYDLSVDSSDTSQISYSDLISVVVLLRTIR
jgi:hypothetical protein